MGLPLRVIVIGFAGKPSVPRHTNPQPSSAQGGTVTINDAQGRIAWHAASVDRARMLNRLVKKCATDLCGAACLAFSIRHL
jgi:hypothetical protein